MMAAAGWCNRADLDNDRHSLQSKPVAASPCIRVITISIVHGLELRTVDRYLAPAKSPVSRRSMTEPPADLPDRRTVVATKAGYDFLVTHQSSG